MLGASVRLESLAGFQRTLQLPEGAHLDILDPDSKVALRLGSQADAIGKAHPVSLFVETFGTENVPVERIEKAINEVFDLRPAAIIRDLDLLRPIYQQTAAYGHFGRELPDLRWESTDRAQDLKNAAA